MLYQVTGTSATLGDGYERSVMWVCNVRGSSLSTVVVAACASLVLIVAPVHADVGDGYIEGRIVDEATDAPIAAGAVAAYDLSGGWVAAGVFTTEGGYRIGPIPAGSYRIGFHDDSVGYQDEWWQDRSDVAEADSVVVIAGETTGGVVLVVSRMGRPGEGWIEGRLFQAESGEVIPAGFRLAINAYDAAGGPAGGAMAWTGPGGSYRLPLPAGTYRLEFIDSSAFAYEGTWWSDKADLAGADPVTIVAGETTIGVDWSLRLIHAPAVSDGFIEGRLYLADTGEPLPADFRLQINAFDSTGDLVRSSVAWTDSSGRYRIDLPSGVHRLQFVDSSVFIYEGAECPCTEVDGSEGGHTAWWPAAATHADAAPVEVAAGDVTPGVDWPLRLSDVQPAAVVGGELPFGGLEVSTVAGMAMAFLVLGVLLVASVPIPPRQVEDRAPSLAGSG